MAPKDYIAARTPTAAAIHHHHHHVVLIDDRPYFPFMVLDGSDHALIRSAVARIISQIPVSNNSSKNSELNSNVNAVKISAEHDHTPSWPVSVVTGGNTNQLFRVEITTKNRDTKEDTSWSVLVRIFGAEGMIDRDIENATFAGLAQQGLAPAYYGRFANGRLEEWLDGMRPLATRELPDPVISHNIARQLSHIHARFQMPDGLQDYHNAQKPSLWTQIHAWMDQAAAATFQSDKDTERASQLPLQDIPAELKWLQQEVVPKDSKVAFCHNDVLAANIMYYDTTTGTGNIRLIDFEYGGMNYIAFDVANHFNEFAGGTDENGVTNYDWFPSKEQQLAFLKTYLEDSSTSTSSTTTSGTIVCTNDQVCALYDQVQAFVLVNHLYWGLWAVNSAATEGCQGFDYLLYAHNRLARYFESKQASQ